MINITRSPENPFLKPNKTEEWQAHATFNPNVIKVGSIYHMVFRALAPLKAHENLHIHVSSIGYAHSTDGIHFSDPVQIITPTESWERYSCEDPMITFINDQFYIFYTAISEYPFTPDGIKVGLAITKDFKSFKKHPVTTFNSKAMTLFPEKINGKLVAILTANTDLPPGKIALAFFEKEEDIWSVDYWKNWYLDLDSHVIPLMRNSSDHVEFGAGPVKTEKGWVFIYSHIKNYFTSNKIFDVEAVLLDINHPNKIIGRTHTPLLRPETDYELNGDIPNIVFPSGLLLENGKLDIYYGATDTTGCLAYANLQEVLKILTLEPKKEFIPSKNNPDGFMRYSENPIISPRPEFSWEALATYNPGAIYADGKVHILYRAFSNDYTSTIGYASTKDGFHIDERLSFPIFKPEEIFCQKLKIGNSGCEDPRITRMGDRLYMFYTAYDGYSPRVAFTSILEKDFLEKKWNWEKHKVITPPDIDDKNACLMPKKINNKYVIFHRSRNNIYIDFVDDLLFDKNHWLSYDNCLLCPNTENPHMKKVGMSAPPIETKEGWLLFYHWLTESERMYHVGALLLDLNDPMHIISPRDIVLLEPEMDYEKIGLVPNVVFPCGAIELNGDIFLYYGGADTVTGVAKMALKDILKKLGK